MTLPNPTKSDIVPKYVSKEDFDMEHSYRSLSRSIKNGTICMHGPDAEFEAIFQLAKEHNVLPSEVREARIRYFRGVIDFTKAAKNKI